MPHLGGAWEREVTSVKVALHVTLGAQVVTAEVLRTVLIEVEGILNTKLLSDDQCSRHGPSNSNYLLMGQPNSSLPQVVYLASEIFSRRTWLQSQVLADQF